MEKHQAPVGSRKHILLCALAFAVTLLATSAQGQSSSWLIQVNINTSNGNLSYNVIATPIANGGCPTATPPYVGNNVSGNIYPCANDQIKWQAPTGSNELVVFIADGILNTDTFTASNGGTTSTATIKPGYPNVPNSHEYFVALYDKGQQQMHHGDPVIIIGGNQPQLRP
jgi:hypothetical protein